ncbi:hypothetical protein F2P56_013172 [Juglans regia]|uniref:Protein SAR DEFICIENT 1-like n=2 Tax=Juglans regia TaxID=51240 RepID=A0A2I4FFY0_JUGRE|nr:protein SAR DEFICIENT 1-like [Juglans regia]KAF5469072.1 hypothetical protein F2P56_013172 [Juglans regia]
MAAKRFFNESESNQDQPGEKRRRPRSFASVIGEVVMVNSIQNIFSGLEPLLRRVVKEEVENSLKRCSHSLTRSPSLRIQALEPSSLRLIFRTKLSLPIFTGSKIADIDNNPLHVLLVDKSGDPMLPIHLPHPIKIEIVVLDGDFLAGQDCGTETWTSKDYDNKIVKERTGKRPLLAGELVVTMRDGVAPIGDIEFTDNSSWIRSRKFRLGAKVAPGSYQGIRISEAMTEAFVVKDHRGELYKKHHPPALGDEVWRLEKIGKEGAFHKKLQNARINTVQEFLKLYVVDSQKLRKILGPGMSEKMWEVTIKHARTCVLGSKRYLFQRNEHVIILNPICQVVRAVIDGQLYPTRDLNNINRNSIQELARAAYANWSSLQEVDGTLMHETPLLTQGETIDEQYYPNHHHQLSMVKSFHHQQDHHEGYNTVDHRSNIDVVYGGLGDEHIRSSCSDWIISMPIENGMINYSTISDQSSSDGEFIPSKLPFLLHD